MTDAEAQSWWDGFAWGATFGVCVSIITMIALFADRLGWQ